MTTTNDYKFKPSELFLDALLDKLVALFDKALTFLGSPGPAPDALAA
jgi:hypothetical protein